MTVKTGNKHRYRIADIRKAPIKRAKKQSRREPYFTALAFAAGAGVAAGAYGYYSMGGGEIGSMISEISSGNFLISFMDSLLLLMVYIILFFFGGLSSVGKPIAYLLCVFKGMGAGFLSACLFSAGVGSIDAAAAAEILPFEAMSLAVVILAARENIRLSHITAKRTFAQAEGNGADISLYLKKFGVIIAAAAAVSAIDGLMSVLCEMF